MDYYTPGHKYFRKKLFEFEQLIATTDFNNTLERQKVHDEFEELSFYLSEMAKFEIENCHILLKDKEPFIVAQVEAGYKIAYEKDKQFRNVLGTKEGHDKRSRLSTDDQFSIYLACIEFVDTYRQLFSYKEKNLVPVLCKHNTDKALKALALQSRSQMSLEQIKDNIVDRIIPCLNFYEKIEAIKEIKDGATSQMFDEVWKTIAEQFKPHQRTLILESLNAATV